MRIVFMGSPDIAATSLQRLLAAPGIDVAGVVTQPDRPKGRGLQCEPCAARAYACDRGLPTYAARSINDPAGLQQLRAWAPELIVVVAFGQILKRAVLELPRLGCVNLHTSLLPRWRGAAPIQWAIAAGDEVTGVTTMYMDVGMDTGDIIAQRQVAIGPEDTGDSLHDKLADVGADLLVETLVAMSTGTASRCAQDHAAATYARKLTKQDGHIQWAHAAGALHDRIRAFNPWPCCTCALPGTRNAPARLRVLDSTVERVQGEAPGTILEAGGNGPLVACGQDALRLVRVQPAGKRAMDGSDFLRGYRLCIGEIMQ